MESFTIKSTEFEKVILDTHENSVSINYTENFKNKNTSTTHNNKSLLNVAAKSIDTIQYKQSSNTTEHGNKNKMLVFLILAAIAFILFLVFIGGKSPIVGVIFLVVAVVCGINAYKNRPSSEKRTGAEFALFDVEGNKIYGVHTILSTEEFDAIVKAIRAIQ